MASISLLIPMKDSEAYLPPLLEDIRRQTEPFAEVIFADDRSTDRSRALVEAAGYRVIAAPGRGPSAGRNLLLAAASAPWVHFHDSDDRIRPDFVAAFSAALPAEAGRDAWFCDSDRANRRTGWHEVTSYRELGPETDWVRHFLGGTITFISHIQMVFPRAPLLAAGGYNEALRSGEDVNFHLRLASAGMRFHYLEKVLVEQDCGRPGSLTSQTVPLGVHRATLVSCEQLFDILPERYRGANVTCLTDLAVIFSSYGLRDEMERALRLARQSQPSGRLIPSRPSLRLASRLVGLPLVCRARWLALAVLRRRRTG